LVKLAPLFAPAALGALRWGRFAEKDSANEDADMELGNLETERKQQGVTGIRQKRNDTPESIGLVSIKAQADV
jgi:hypothetical protein